MLLARLPSSGTCRQKPVYIIKVSETSKERERILAILNRNNSSVDCLSFIKKIASNIIYNIFFFKYPNGICSEHSMKRIEFGEMPCVIATYLNLPNLTGTMLANSG